MIYTLQEITVPLLVAFVVGVGVGWLAWRWRRTPVDYEEWTSMQARVAAADDAVAVEPVDTEAQNQKVVDLTAAVEIRDIEIAQLRRAFADLADD